MKQFIVLLAVIPILMFFMLQMGLDQRNSQITTIIQACVYSAKEDAKQEGCFTPEIVEKMKNDISKLTGIDKELIKVEADDEVKYRNSTGKDRLINYKVYVYVDEIMAAGQIYGIDDKENGYILFIKTFNSMWERRKDMLMPFFTQNFFAILHFFIIFFSINKHIQRVRRSCSIKQDI